MARLPYCARSLRNIAILHVILRNDVADERGTGTRGALVLFSSYAPSRPIRILSRLHRNDLDTGDVEAMVRLANDNSCWGAVTLRTASIEFRDVRPCRQLIICNCGHCEMCSPAQSSRARRCAVRFVRRMRPVENLISSAPNFAAMS